MENKYLKKQDISKLLIKERILSIFMLMVVTFGTIGGTIYTVDKFLRDENKGISSGNIDKINKEKIYKGIINLEGSEELDTKRELAQGVKDGFDKYESSSQIVQSSTNSEDSSSSWNSEGFSSGENGSNNLVVVDNSSITGINARIHEGQKFNPIKDLKLRATDINGKDISDKINIIENTVDIYAPGQYIVKAVAPLSNKSKKEIILTVNVEPITLNLTVNSFKSTSEAVNKGETAILNLELYSNKDYISASTVNINGIDYPVKKVETRNKYQKYMIELPVGNEAGIIEYNLSSIRMADNTVINVNEKVDVNVLKERPSVVNFSYEEIKSIDSSKISIKLDLEDNDKALLNEIAWLHIYNDEGKILKSRIIFANEKNTLNHDVSENGEYIVKVIGESDVYGRGFEKEELFAETIEVKGVNKSRLSGENIKIKLGEEFDPIRDLKIKALDVDGTDITEKVVIEEDNVDVNIPGEYIVKVLVINKNNEELRKEFVVEVTDSILNRILGRNIADNKNESIDFKNDSISYSGIYLSDDKKNTITVSGKDDQVFQSDVIISGEVLKGNGGAPSGKIEVELPMRVNFTVDKDGKFIGTNFDVKNNGGCDIKLSLESFTEENPIGGIIINNNLKEFESVGRATIALGLKAISNGDIVTTKLDETVSNQELVTIGEGKSATIHIIGKAGTSKSNEEDTNGATETFTLRFRIKKV